MKKIIEAFILSIFVISLGFFMPSVSTNSVSLDTSIRLSPVSKILQIDSGSNYDESFEISNDGASDIKVEVNAVPYSYSNSNGFTSLDFTSQNNFTQISRWISFLKDGSYTSTPTFLVPANSSIKVDFRITTPKDIPSGGQYAVIFVRTITDSANDSIRTEASPGIIIYGRSTSGDAVSGVELTDLKINRKSANNNILASAKVKNTGNIDLTTTGKLVIEPIIGIGSYGTEDDQPTSRISVIPEAEIVLTDELNESPDFGIYRATWTINAADTTKTISRTLLLVPAWIIVLILSLLTILTIWIIIRIRRRKHRRSRIII